MDVKDIALIAAHAAEEKKANNIVVLDIQNLSIIADYFVICHGNSETQVQSIVDEVKDQFEKNQLKIKGLEGYDSARWVLIDVGDVIIHVFHKDEREFYNIERLWGDAPTLRIAGN